MKVISMNHKSESDPAGYPTQDDLTAVYDDIKARQSKQSAGSKLAVVMRNLEAMQMHIKRVSYEEEIPLPNLEELVRESMTILDDAMMDVKLGRNL